MRQFKLLLVIISIASLCFATVSYVKYYQSTREPYHDKVYKLNDSDQFGVVVYDERRAKDSELEERGDFCLVLFMCSLIALVLLELFCIPARKWKPNLSKPASSPTEYELFFKR